MTDTSKVKLNTIAQAIFDKKGFNILALDVSLVSSLSDYCLIAEGNVDRHLQSIAISIRDKLAELGFRVRGIDGLKEGQWIVLDCGNIFVHLVTSEARELYCFEELWQHSKVVNVKIDVSKSHQKNEG